MVYGVLYMVVWCIGKSKAATAVTHRGCNILLLVPQSGHQRLQDKWNFRKVGMDTTSKN